MGDVLTIGGIGGLKMRPFPPKEREDGTLFRDAVTETIREYGCWEPDETEIILELLPPGEADSGYFVDVGAQLGYYSLIAASRGYKVLSFEYDIDVYATLVENIRLNGFQNLITPYRRYVCDTCDGVAKGVPRVSIDALADAFKLSTYGIRLLKVDVEGFDPLVIRGAMECFRNRSIHAAIVEISPKFEKRTPFSQYVKMAADVAGLGYAVYDIGIAPKRRLADRHDHLGRLAGNELTSFDEAELRAMIGAKGQTNFLFVRTAG
ncbi:hypothetical protein RUR49_12885 [Pseudoxanthobacter sp. M-2]|uniref:hypothetical protein n=1 Tax=Pseudoxanthobacter sp. M-2 TaxID=3078754 RepID=UPI0038FC592B